MAKWVDSAMRYLAGRIGSNLTLDIVCSPAIPWQPRSDSVRFVPALRSFTALKNCLTNATNFIAAELAHALSTSPSKARNF